MKIVINNCFGGFGINDKIAKQYNLDRRHVERTDPTLIKLLESGVNCNTPNSELIIIDIPDNSTDWRIIECDGAEYVLYVVNGKIHSIC